MLWWVEGGTFQNQTLMVLHQAGMYINVTVPLITLAKQT
jgi:hypothetical protein